jgi:PTS system ascorbate-specific IIB component
VKIIAVCGMGIGTSVLLKLNAEKVLKMLDLEATVEAADVATVRKVSFDAQIILTTPDLVDQLQGLPAEIISIQHVFDLEELSQKLSKALL